LLYLLTANKLPRECFLKNGLVDAQGQVVMPSRRGGIAVIPEFLYQLLRIAQA
jgi:hypothetical protein